MGSARVRVGRWIRYGCRRPAPVGQPAEPMLSNSIQCGFESHPGHQTGARKHHLRTSQRALSVPSSTMRVCIRKRRDARRLTCWSPGGRSTPPALSSASAASRSESGVTAARNRSPAAGQAVVSCVGSRAWPRRPRAGAGLRRGAEGDRRSAPDGLLSRAVPLRRKPLHRQLGRDPNLVLRGPRHDRRPVAAVELEDDLGVDAGWGCPPRRADRPQC